MNCLVLKYVTFGSHFTEHTISLKSLRHMYEGGGMFCLVLLRAGTDLGKQALLSN